MTVEFSLPDRFSALHRFADWARPTSGERMVKRLQSSREERVDFYNHMLPQIRDITELLNQYPLEDIPPSLLPLANMSLAFAQVAIGVEWFDGRRKDEEENVCITMIHEPGHPGVTTRRK